MSESGRQADLARWRRIKAERRREAKEQAERTRQTLLDEWRRRRPTVFRVTDSAAFQARWQRLTGTEWKYPDPCVAGVDFMRIVEWKIRKLQGLEEREQFDEIATRKIHE